MQLKSSIITKNGFTTLARLREKRMKTFAIQKILRDRARAKFARPTAAGSFVLAHNARRELQLDVVGSNVSRCVRSALQRIPTIIVS